MEQSKIIDTLETYHGGTITAVIVFINITIFITILISFMRSTLPHPAVIPYLNMVLYVNIMIQ